MTVDPDLLRRPEQELFRTPEAVSGFAEHRALDIRRPFPPVILEPQVDWAWNPYGDKTWCLYWHSLYWVHAIDETILRHPEREAELAELLRDLVMSYVDFFAGGGESVDQVLDDHAVSYRLSHVAFVYARHLAGRLSPGEDARLRAFALRHLEILRGYLASDRWLYSNHTLFQIEGTLDGALAFLEGDARQEAYDFALAEFAAWTGRCIDAEEGSAAEHAAFYHIFLMARIRDFALYAAPLVGEAKVAFALDLVGKMAPFLWDMSVSLGKLPGFGDSKHDMFVGPKYLKPFLKAPYRNELTDALAAPPETRSPRAGLACYPRKGYYFARSGSGAREMMLSVMDKPFVGPHGHVDGLSFELYRARQPLLVDSGGPYKYGNKLRFQYFRKPLGHNGLIVEDGQHDYVSRVTRATHAGGRSLIKGLAKVAPGLVWRRGFVLLRGDHLVLLDVIEGDREGRSAYLRLQTAPGAGTDETGDGTGRVLHVTPPKSDPFSIRVFQAAGAPFDPAAMPAPAPFAPDGTPGGRSLHDIALVTSRDNYFAEAPVLRIPLETGALMVTIVSPGLADLPGCEVSRGTDGTRIALPAAEGPGHALEIRHLLDDEGRLFDFRMSATDGRT
ncbi:heparinase II/III domain-containing protein [Jannaschia formosa]|uniref:heparinase II/III domain-containing protein n=1 Tax=Jannaschia formosa TaxID=2259592 RepID=UPI000E1BC958|nr:heparinase II/III family protein [Jannaschia formosa]TFL17140.1 hypothetical protein DR046_16510 [Jannaschia formosa]